jgi:GntR family transcriptional regulator
MNDDTTINRASIKHAYQQVTDAITSRITSGYYAIKLPAERHLAEEFGVSYVTVRHATAILRDRNLIISIHGRGTYIAAALTGTRPPASRAE